MNRDVISFRSLLGLLTRALAIVVLLSAPVLAVPVLGSPDTNIIEAPAPAKTGLGFVLLISLQRG